MRLRLSFIGLLLVRIVNLTAAEIADSTFDDIISEKDIAKSLYDAAGSLNLEEVNNILSREGINPNFRYYTMTPLIAAIFRAVRLHASCEPIVLDRALQVVDRILTAGADPNMRQGVRAQSTPLSITVLSKGVLVPKIIDKLLNAGAEIDAVNSLGNTALASAVLFDNLPAVSKLITAGANRMIRNYDGELAREHINRESRHIKALRDILI